MALGISQLTYRNRCSVLQASNLFLKLPMAVRCCLTGHKSIVNTTLFHPILLHIATAGVESQIVLHSPTASSPCVKDLHLTPTNVRELPSRDDTGGRVAHALVMGLPLNSDEGDTETIALFDE
jgi:WD repeat-containing protein 22